MEFKITLFLLIFCVVQSSAVNYTVTASEKFRPDTDYKFIVTIYGENSVSYQLKARIKKNRVEESITDAEFQVEPPGLHQVFDLKIPRIVQAGQYVFEVVAQGDVVFNKSHRVQLSQKSHSLFIQTDKYLYKPGQTVLFRVLGIQPDLKPYTDNINTTIYDQSNNRIYELLNQRNQSGVISGSLKLSHITPLGRWKIEAKSETLKKEVFFEVAEYVLPKFEVKVLSPSYFFANRNNPSTQQPLHIAVTATYTFGKPVKGYAVVTIKVRSGWGFTYAPSLLKHVEKN